MVTLLDPTKPVDEMTKTGLGQAGYFAGFQLNARLDSTKSA